MNQALRHTVGLCHGARNGHLCAAASNTWAVASAALGQRYREARR